MGTRVRLRFADLTIEFVDREKALRRVEEWVKGVLAQPVVVFGPEGCGKSAWLRQAAEVLKEHGFEVIYVDVTHREYVTHTDVREVIEKISEIVASATGFTPIKLADIVVVLAKELLRRWRKKKIALLIDEVFQAIGLDKAEVYVKMLLNLIEYPPAEYEKIIAVIATSEELSRWRIGRHRWALLKPMWNMPRRGFEELYEKIPEPKPNFDDIWKLTGGNPYALLKLYQSTWASNRAVSEFVADKNLAPSFVRKWRKWLELAVEDPDSLWSPDVPEELVNELISRNLIVYFLHDRDPYFWIDEPPPERDLEVGVGRHVAWQTPLHREAVKLVLKEL